MGIAIQPLDLQNIHDVDRCDGSFWVDSKLILSLEYDRISYRIVDLEPFIKRYPLDQVGFNTYIDHPDKVAYLAYLDGQVAGQMRVCRYWNRYAYIEDIVVDNQFRRRGIGRALIQQAIQWANEQQLAGVMLETQNNNLAACRLYESCGFRLGGIDRFLYQGLQPGTDEIALYWYWVQG
jgi:ribosomal protein S18 acetylase RimI-like enzyme